MTEKLSKDDLVKLFDVSLGPCTCEVTTDWAKAAETLVTRGLVKVHRSSIGELDERGTYTIAPAGAEALQAHIDEARSRRAPEPR